MNSSSSPFVLRRSKGERPIATQSQSGEDWRKAAKAKRSAPTAAGPLMQEFVGKLWLEQLLCPSCGALFESKMVEVS